MLIPTEYDVGQLLHRMIDYDPVKAHEYYLRTRKLKGRKRGHAVDSTSRISGRGLPKWRDPRTGKKMDQIHREAKAKQRQELSDSIDSLSNKLKKLEARIRELEREEASEDRKGAAKKERAAKERDKPKSAAEKREQARESEKYRDKHKQELKSKAKKDSDKSDNSSDKESAARTHKVSKLKAQRTKVKGQLAVAKQKLAAL